MSEARGRPPASDAGRRDQRRRDRRWAALRRLVASLFVALSLPASLLTLDSAWTAATHPGRRSVVTEVSEGAPRADTWDPRAATVFLNGLGLDISTAQAAALAPSVGRYGRVLALEYAPVFDPDEAADAVHAALVAHTPEPQRPAAHYLTVVASSMGDVRGLEVVASIRQRHPEVFVEGFIVNTGPGPGKRDRVKGGDPVQHVLEYGCTVFVPGQLTMGVVEVVNQMAQGLDLTNARAVSATFLSGTQYRGRVVMNQLCSLTRPSSLERPPYVPFTAYLMPGRPEDDVVVDVVGAYFDWRQVLPGMQVRRVEGATHDNLSYRPDLFNPLFADDLMPALRAARIARENVRPPRHGTTPGVARPV